MQIERTLYILTGNERRIPVQIRLFAPQKNDKSWSCAYEVDWPEKRRRMSMHGIDGVQALMLALQAVGSEIHASRYHADGKLVWEEPGKGYGFPVAKGLQDLLADEDR